MSKQPMTCHMDADWCTFRCPCGGEFCTRWDDGTMLREWISSHYDHSDGRCEEIITPDGARFMRPHEKPTYFNLTPPRGKT